MVLGYRHKCPICHSVDSRRVFACCSDKQQRALVTKVVSQTHGVMSNNTNPLLDTLLMILSKRFLGNAVSSMSLNVHEIRDTIFHNDAIDALV